MPTQWTTADIPALRDRIAVVTGANRGLGFEIARGLAGAGATVILACREPGKAQAAVAELRRQTRAARLETIALDLADLSSVRRFAEEFSARHPKLDLLCNNASAIMVSQGKTRDGFEMHMGVNHLGHFALTGLLLERLRSAPQARVVSTSSMSHRMTAGLRLDDFNLERVSYKPMDAYGRSKLAVLLFAFEFDRRARKAGLPVLSVAAHPGYANTNPDFGGFFMRRMTALMAQPPAMGALPALYAATNPNVVSGEHYGPGGFKELRGYPVKVACAPSARDTQAASQLWTLSETLTGVKYLSDSSGGRG